jgi:hypothetical protein
MNEDQFKDAIAAFRGSMRQQGDLIESPGLEAILRPAPAAGRLRPVRWVVTTAVVLILGAIPVSYERSREQQRAAEQAKEDALLLEKVNAGLSRTVPRSLEPLLGRGESR